MSSNKQNIDFFLPSLINNHKFQQLFYHQNKLIVYDSSQCSKKLLISPKAIEMLQRPKTSVSISSKLSNRLMQARSKASIQKFITTHKRIHQERKKTQTSYLPKKKYNRNLGKKTQESKLQNILTQDQSVKRDQPIIYEVGKENVLNVHISQASIKKVEILEPQEKLMKQIAEKTHASQRRSVRLSIREIKSLDRNPSSKDINDKSPDQSNFNTLSASRQKAAMSYKAKNTYPLRKSVIISPNDVQKTSKTNLSSFSNFSNKQKHKKDLTKQPQINKQKSETSESNSEKIIKAQTQWIQKLFNPIYSLFGPKDFYKNNQSKTYFQDLQIPNHFGVLPRECFFSTETEKRKSYIDNRIHHLERKIHEQQDIINHKKQEIQKLIHDQQRPQKGSDSVQKSQIKSSEQNTSEAKMINSNINKLTSIQKESDSKRNFNCLKDEKEEQALKQQIENLRTIQQQNHLENQSSSTFSKLNLLNQKESLMGVSIQTKFRVEKSTKQQKRIVLTSKLREKQNLLEIEQQCLKRAQIIKFLDKQYYASVKGLYWVLINQKKNAFLLRKADEKENLQHSESLKYIKEFHKNRSQMIKESSVEFDYKHSEQRVYVDKEFSHENIQLSNMKEEIHWLYFKPCTHSSIFPSDLKLPQHYIITESQSSSINSLVSLLNCILNLNPNLIERLFEPTYNNVFSCWLNKENRFEPVHVDGYLPYNGKLNSALAWSEEFLWIGILIKCCAKLFGGYDELFRLNFNDWTRVILGKSLTILQKPSYEEIKQWQEEEFESKVIEYLAKNQQKHKSSLVVGNKLTLSLFLITGINKNKIKLSHVHQKTKRLQISLFEFIIDDNYELILFPESPTSYHLTSEFQSFQKGNIVTYQLKVKVNKSHVTICAQLSSEQKSKSEFSKAKDQFPEMRRILIYEIPYPGKKERKQRNEMILKYSSVTHPYTRVLTNHQGIQTVQMDLPQIKKGQYKIFIECGRIKLNDYFESHSKSINRWLKTEESTNDKGSLMNFKNSKNENRRFRNVFTVMSSHPVGVKGGKSLIVNEKVYENELIEDENFVYRQGKGNHISTEEEYA